LLAVGFTAKDPTDYFALTPEAVGTTDWEEFVAQYMGNSAVV
jgi:hypothetical protein